MEQRHMQHGVDIGAVDESHGACTYELLGRGFVQRKSDSCYDVVAQRATGMLRDLLKPPLAPDELVVSWQSLTDEEQTDVPEEPIGDVAWSVTRESDAACVGYVARSTLSRSKRDHHRTMCGLTFTSFLNGCRST